MKLVPWPHSSLEMVSAFIHKSHNNNWPFCVGQEHADQVTSFFPPKGQPRKMLLGNSTREGPCPPPAPSPSPEVLPASNPPSATPTSPFFSHITPPSSQTRGKMQLCYLYGKLQRYKADQDQRNSVLPLFYSKLPGRLHVKSLVAVIYSSCTTVQGHRRRILREVTNTSSSFFINPLFHAHTYPPCSAELLQ